MPSITVRPQSWAVRTIALLLLTLQALVAVLPSFETRPASGEPVVHVEQQGTRHVDLHNDATCLLCAARSVVAAPPSAPVPLFDGARTTAPVAGTLLVATPTDVHLGSRSRAPPALV